MNPIYFKVLQSQVDVSKDLTSQDAVGTGIYIGVLFLVAVAIVIISIRRLKKNEIQRKDD